MPAGTIQSSVEAIQAECDREDGEVTGQQVILALKIAVAAVTVLLLISLGALWRGNYRLHGRINLVFFMLTLTALLGFEVIIRIVDEKVYDYIWRDPDLSRRLRIHLCFSVPSALLMPVMLYTGLKGLRPWHIALAVVFGVLWAGTFVTGVFFLPH
jgi:uncharacterized membrane protein YozB (DUF420 family)